MNLKAEIIALGLRVLADRGLVRQPDSLDNLFSVIFTGQTAEQRLAEDLAAASDKAIAAAKQMNVDRKFKKIIKNSK